MPSQDPSRDRVVRRIAPLLSGPLAWILSQLLPASACEFWVRHLSANLTWPLAEVATLIPISASEILVVSIVAGVAIDGLRRLRQRGQPRSWRIGAWIFDLLRTASVLVAAFYLLWGFGYHAPPLDQRLGLPALDPANAERTLETMARSWIALTNAAYVEIHGTSDSRSPTPAPSLREMTASLRRSFDDLKREQPSLLLMHGGRAPVKELLSGEVFHRLGISGIYSPFFAEAHVVASLPGAAMGQVLGHEMSHQRGINREDEASFVGVLVATRSDRPELRYSAWLFAQRQALQTLAAQGSTAVPELIAARLPGVQRDVDSLHEYWKVARGRARLLATRMNHAYLRSNRVSDGVASYRRSLDLLLRWYASDVQDRPTIPKGLP